MSALSGLYTDLNCKLNEPLNGTLNVEPFVESPNHLMIHLMGHLMGTLMGSLMGTPRGSTLGVIWESFGGSVLRWIAGGFWSPNLTLKWAPTSGRESKAWIKLLSVCFV